MTAASVTSTAGSGFQPRNAPIQRTIPSIANANVTFTNRAYAAAHRRGN